MSKYNKNYQSDRHWETIYSCNFNRQSASLYSLNILKLVYVVHVMKMTFCWCSTKDCTVVGYGRSYCICKVILITYKKKLFFLFLTFIRLEYRSDLTVSNSFPIWSLEDKSKNAKYIYTWIWKNIEKWISNLNRVPYRTISIYDQSTFIINVYLCIYVISQLFNNWVIFIAHKPNKIKHRFPKILRKMSMDFIKCFHEHSYIYIAVKWVRNTKDNSSHQTTVHCHLCLISTI